MFYISITLKHAHPSIAMMLSGMQPWQMWSADASAHYGLLDGELAGAVFETVRS